MKNVLEVVTRLIDLICLPAILWIFRARQQWPDMYFGTDQVTLKRQLLSRRTQVVYEATIDSPEVFDEHEGNQGRKAHKDKSSDRSIDRMLQKEGSEVAGNINGEDGIQAPPILILNPCDLTEGQALEKFLETYDPEEDAGDGEGELSQPRYIDFLLQTISLGFADEMQK